MKQDRERKRPIREEVRIARQALTLVRPLNHQIARWQLHAARLAAQGARPQSEAAARAALLAEAEALAQSIREHRLWLDAVSDSLPPPVARSGRMTDTKLALGSVERSVDRAVGLLRGAPKTLPRSLP